MFGDAPVERAALVRAAVVADARDVLLGRLRALSDELLAEPDDLWFHLPDVPEDLQQT